MAIHWQIQFKSFTGASRCVNIYDSTYSGDPVQLTGAANPFKTSEDDDLDYYAPIRTQSGYISIIAENNTILDDLMATKSTDRPVTLTEGNYVLWMGFLHCELYSQPWEAPPYVVQIPIISAVAAYQGVEVPSTEGSITLLDLLNMITVPDVTIEYVVPDGLPIDTLQVPLDAFRDYLSIPERTEYGVTGKYYRQSVYDAIEAFCKYYGVSCRQYQDQIMLVRDNEQHYNDMDRTGDTREAQWSNTSLDSMTICGAKNYRDFAQAYKRVKGTFQTQREKLENVMSYPNFFEEYGYNSAPAGNQIMLFNGNAITLPYKNGTQQVSWFAAQDYGGQIIRKRGERSNSIEQRGSGWTDFYMVMSKAAQAGTPSPAIKFDIQKYIFIVDNEYTALNIDCNVSPYYDLTQGEGFIKKLHCKVKVGEYWLHTVEQAGYLPRYEWTTTESTCFLMVKDTGNLTMDGVMYTLDYYINFTLNKVSGFAIDMPALTPGAHEVYFELLANAEAAADFGTFSDIGYLISDLKINVLHGTASPTQPTPNLDQNEIIRTAGAAWANDYEIEGTITTKRGTQYGAGCALDENLEYITTKYDEQGIARRAAFYAVPREVITVDVRDNTQPIDNVTFGGSTYHILSQQIDWWDDINRIKLIKIS
jgi:hypothetical protein